MIEIQYLESTENLKKTIHASQGWRPNSGQAEAIAACLRQGRLFYEAARRAPLEIRPLELYYGAAAYAKALVLSTNRRLTLHSLQQSHGVADKSTHNARLEELSIQISQRGTFQEFNDCIRRLNRVVPLSMDSGYRTFHYPGADSSSIAGMSLSLRDIFSRLPGLQALYRATFYDHENIDFVQVTGPQEGASWTVCAQSFSWGTSRDSFLKSLEYCRKRFPFLQAWSFLEATHSNATIVFQNAPPATTDLNSEVTEEVPWGFRGEHAALSSMFRNVEDHLGPLFAMPDRHGGGYYIQPINGQYLAIQSLQFLALHLLSSLVRYRPATWMHALSRSANSGRPADDAMLALIEAFLLNAQSTIPAFVAEMIRPGLVGMSIS